MSSDEIKCSENVKPRWPAANTVAAGSQNQRQEVHLTNVNQKALESSMELISVS